VISGVQAQTLLGRRNRARLDALIESVLAAWR
jgi:hypothetical protein